MKNVKTKTKEISKKASINTQTRLENLQRLQNIYKEIDYISNQGDLTAAFKDDTKRKAIFATFTDIAHNFKGIANSNDSEVLALFSEQEKRQITGTRNVSAHGSENVAINAAIKYVKFTLVPLKAKILAFVSDGISGVKAMENKIGKKQKVVRLICTFAMGILCLFLVLLISGKIANIDKGDIVFFIAFFGISCFMLYGIFNSNGQNFTNNDFFTDDTSVMKNLEKLDPTAYNPAYSNEPHNIYHH